MPRLGPIQFDDNILDALNDDRLVIFAGAGVSNGPPADLPDFERLAKHIAVSTTLEQEDKEPIDHFLGRLSHKGIKVHQLAAEQLSDPASSPTELHMDLVRLFGNSARLRLVTTNFDLHFETAAQTIFGKCPEVFRAPALPLGGNFRGLVHVHGALTHPQEMVLTDADFGRGYLTEGWARRFLVDVFRTYTVLFVGYSHSDVVMKYLARALPTTGDAVRYALTEESRNWKALGITTIPFQKGAGENAFQELYDGIRCLAERAARGVLDWQNKLAQISRRVPPADDETIGEIEQALREIHTTRFFVKVARLPEWLKWLDARKQLDALFDSATLNQREKLLADWLAEHYAFDHPDEVIGLIAAHNMQLNPELWSTIGFALGLDDKKTLSDSTLSRWVTILLASSPPYADYSALAWLAERCARQGNVKAVLEVFLFMGRHRLTIKPGFDWRLNEEGEQNSVGFEAQTPLRSNHYDLNEIWTKHLKPNLPVIAQPLLSGIVRQLEEIYHTLLAWNNGEIDEDWLTNRWAIEPHEQDKYPEPLFVLIDAGRDVLEWSALHQPTLFHAWKEQMIVSDVPLIRRLAIHALTACSNNTADDQINWLLTHIDLYAIAEDHEVHRTVALTYPLATTSVRKAIIDAVLRHQLLDPENCTMVEQTDRVHFNWLCWLHQADQACMLVQMALNPIKMTYPEWKCKDHTNPTHRNISGWPGPRSPWPVEQLLNRPPAEQLDDLLNFKGNRLFGPDREGLRMAIQEACKKESLWAFQLDEALSARALWDSDLWVPVLRGTRDAELALEDWKHVLNSIARHDLHIMFAREIADLVYALVRRGGKPFALELLDQADNISFDLWNSLSRGDEEDVVTDWLSKAINRPAGVLVEFWTEGLSIRLHGKPGDERTLPSNYRKMFTAVAKDETIVGGLGRSVLASQTAFLFNLDETWTREYIIPLFTSADAQKFKQAWDGFLVWGRLNASLVEVLEPAFLAALIRLDPDVTDRRKRFIEFFTELVVFHVNDPTPHLLPALFNKGSLVDRVSFASQIGFFLEQMTENMRHDVWDRWLNHYWQKRLQSVPLQLDEAEACQMLEWLPHLGELFPQGVSLAVAAPLTRIEHVRLIHKMRESDLVTRFPTEMAKLVIYLCPRVASYHGIDIKMIIKRLPALDSELKHRLDESIARAFA